MKTIWRQLLRPRVHSLRVGKKSLTPSGRAKSLGLMVVRGQAGSRRMLDPDRTLEIHCGNCRAKFRPWYGANDSGLQTIQVNRCGLCEGDPLMKLMYEKLWVAAGCVCNRPWKSQDHQSVALKSRVLQ